MLKRIITLALVIAVALSAALYAYDHLFTVKLPTYASAARTVWLDQKWTREQRDWFHHADQGTQTFRIPYDWFIALEQPALFAGKAGLLSDAAYLDRYGFIPSDSSTEVLPIGFAHGGQMRHDDGSIWKNPRTSNSQARIGLTCARATRADSPTRTRRCW